MSLTPHTDGSESQRSANDADGEPSGRDGIPSTSPPSLLVRKSGKDGEKRHVTFPEDDSQLITGYLEPVNPWQSVGEVSGSELIAEYVASCDRHNTTPQQAVLDQLKDYVFLGTTHAGSLSLSSQPLLPAQCEALEVIFKRVRFNRIEVCNAGLTDETAIALFDMLEYYESTLELDISCNTEFGMLGWQACSKMINKSQYLEHLEARGTSLSENTAPVLGRGLRSPCTLRVLHLQRAGLRGRPMLCLASALKQNKSVRELHIGDNNLIPEDASHLASLLRANTFLQLLDISNNDIQDLGVERIADALSEQSTPSPSPSSSTSTSSSSTGDSTTSSPQSANSSSCQERGLAVLIVWNNNLTRNSGHHLSKALTRCKSLEVLNIGQNPLGGEAINRVRVALQQNRSLLCLGVQGARLGAEAGVALAEVIEDNHCIQRIDLRDNKLQAAGLLALSTALKNNFALTRLDLDDALPSHNSGVGQPIEEARLVNEIRALCHRNETMQNQHQSSPGTPSSEENIHRRRVASFSTRKISLTCQTLHRSYEPISEPALSPPKMASGRLRSPLPSPVPSPASSPTPSPSHRSRFIVSRVSDSSSVTSESSSPSTPPSARSFFPNSRFKVVTVQEPPKINVTIVPDEAVMEKRNDSTMNITNQSDLDLNKNMFNEIPENKDNITPTDKNTVKERVESNSAGDGDTVGKNDDVQDAKLETVKPSDDINEESLIKEPCSVEITSPSELQEPQHIPPTIKKNKSESSLDSPDLEVSRLMQKKDNYDSSSSLDISGGSIESLNTIESSVNNNVITITTVEPPLKEDFVFPIQDEVEDVFPVKDYKNPFICSVVHDNNHTKKKLSASSNESSLESSTFETGVMVTFPHHGGPQSNLLNSSVSSNESISPNIFGKHLKLHGSVTSLETSVSSLDSCRSKSEFTSPQNPNIFSFATPDGSHLTESTDSGISQSDLKRRTPSFNESFSSNEGTLTSSSNIKSSIFSMGGDSSLSIEEDNDKMNLAEVPSQQMPSDSIPRHVTSLLDVPAMQKSPRMRKISWVAPNNFNPTQQQQNIEHDIKGNDLPQQCASTSKVPSSLEKLLSLFQHPGSIFSRSDAVEKKSNDSSQSSSRRDSQTSMSSSSSFWPWNLSSSTSSVIGTGKGETGKSITLGTLERLKKCGESFETALQFSSNSEKKSDLHASKSDTYLENRDSDITLTNNNADIAKNAILSQIGDSQSSANFSISSSSPPLYSVESEYFKQTLTPCIIHPFQNPNVSANFTLKLSGESKNVCTCGVNEINSPELSTEYTVKCEDSSISSNIKDDENTDLEVQDVSEVIQDIGDFTSFIVPKYLDNSDKQCDSIDKVSVDSRELTESTESNSVNLSSLNDDSTTMSSIDDTIIRTKLDRKHTETESIEMGSVFKFHNVYDELENSDGSHKGDAVVESSTANPNTTANIESTKGKYMKELTESEHRNISEIVDNVCKDAVKTFVRKTKCKDAAIDVCDKTSSPNTLEPVHDDDGHLSTGDSANISDDPAGDAKDKYIVIIDCQVQSVGCIDCDSNYSTLGNNQGCQCDFNKCKCIDTNCKYLNRCKCVVNQNSNSDVDLKIQSLPDGDENFRCSSFDLKLDTEINQNLKKDIPCNYGASSADSFQVSTDFNDYSFTSDNDPAANANIIDSSLCNTIYPTNTDVDSSNEIANKCDNSAKKLSPMGGINDRSAVLDNIKKDLHLDLKKELTHPVEVNERTTPPKQIMVLKQSIGLGNTTSPNDRQVTPDTGPSVSNLPSKIIQRIKENVSPENTLTSSMSNTKALAQELLEKKKVLGANSSFWEDSLKENVEKILEGKTGNIIEDNNSRFYDELLVKPFDNYDEIIKVSPPRDFYPADGIHQTSVDLELISNISTNDDYSLMSDVDQGSDALTVKELISEETPIGMTEATRTDSIVQNIFDEDGSMADISDLVASSTSVTMTDIKHPIDETYRKGNAEKGIELGEQVAVIEDQDSGNRNVTTKIHSITQQQIESIAIDVASDAIIDHQMEISETADVFQDVATNIFKPISILKKSTPSISKTVSLPQNIPEATKPFPYYGLTLPTPKKLYDASTSKSSSLPMRCGSLPENTSILLSDENMDALTLLQSRHTTNLKSPAQNKLGKIARDSLYALNMSEDELKEFRSSGRLSSMDSVRSLGSLSEDLEGLSSSSCIFQSSSDHESILEQGASQDSLVSLDSISENVSESGRRTYDSV